MERKGIPVTAPRIEEWELGKALKITGKITLLHIKTFTNETVIVLLLSIATQTTVGSLWRDNPWET